MHLSLRRPTVLTTRLLGLSLLCILASACPAAKNRTLAPVNQGPSTGQVANTPTSQPVTPVASNLPSAELAPAIQGERPELQRLILALEPKQGKVLPEDYERGPILTGSLAPGSPEETAQTFVRELFRDLKSGTRNKSDGSRFLEKLLTDHQDAFHEIQVVRLLSPSRIDENEAAFSVRLLGTSGSTTVSLFLKPKSRGEGWELTDLQGELSYMTESGRTQYTGYDPQDVERTLIRGGRAKPWL